MTKISLLKSLILGCILGIVGYVAFEYSRPTVLLVGNVTIDLVNKKEELGGAVAYAAAVLSAFGLRACIVTAAGEDADMSAFEGHELHRIPANQTLVFEHTYTWWGNKRVLRVLSQPDVTLSWDHVPRHCKRARTILLGPLMPQDIDCASFTDREQGWTSQYFGLHQHVGLMAQGLQRSLDADKKVIPMKKPSPLLKAALGPEVHVFLSDIETDVWEKGTVERLSEQSGRWLITRGEKGAEEVNRQKSTHLPPHKVDNVVDTNGAGDTFATAYMLALDSGWPSPGSFANWAASRAVMMSQACKPHCVRDGLYSNSTFAQVASWISSKMEVVEDEAQEMVQVAQSRFTKLKRWPSVKALRKTADQLAGYLQFLDLKKRFQSGRL